MKKVFLVTLGFVLTAGIVVIDACKKKEEAAPVADFTVNSTSINEGDSLILTNKSSNGKSYKWSYSGSSWSSTDASTYFVVDSAGTFSLTLEAKNGDGKSSTKKMDITVLPDTVWRMSNNGKKIWIVKSIKLNGVEQLANSCQQDDEFIVYKTPLTSTDTCQITEGTTKCPSGTYLFTLPASSAWRLNKGKFEFALTAFGSPVNLSFAISKCTRREFEGADGVNNVTIKLAEK